MRGLRLRPLFLAGTLTGVLISLGEVLLNFVILGAEWAATLATLKTAPVSPLKLFVTFPLTIVVGIVIIWIYAAAVPLFSHRRAAALAAFLIAWFLLFVYPMVWIAAIGILADRLLLIATIWGFGELLLATAIGAWIYSRSD